MFNRLIHDRINHVNEQDNSNMIQLLDEVGNNFKYELKPINFKSKGAEKNVKQELENELENIFTKIKIFKKLTLDYRKHDLKH